MILFLYGEDNFRLKQKLKEIKQKYLDQSSNDANFSVLNFEDNTDFQKIKSDIEAMPFLTDKRMVVLENYLKSKSTKLQDEIKDYLEKVPEKTIVIFMEEGTPDKRKALFKDLKKKADKSWEFFTLKPYELEKWIRAEVSKQGGKIDNQTVQLLASYVGADLWQMQNEIDKLILYKGILRQAQDKEPITNPDVELLVKAKLNTNIFNLIDALGFKDAKKATNLLEELFESGENEVYIMTMVIYQFRNILIVKDLLERGDNRDKIGKKAHMHPFVLQKTLTQAKNFTMPRLKEIYQKLADTDLAIKTGQMESKIALNLLLVELVK